MCIIWCCVCMNVCDLVCLYATLNIDSGALSLLGTTEPFSLLEMNGILPSLSLFEISLLISVHVILVGFIFFKNKSLLEYMTSGI